MADLADDEALEDELRQHIVEVEHRVEQAQEEVRHAFSSFSLYYVQISLIGIPLR